MKTPPPIGLILALLLPLGGCVSPPDPRPLGLIQAEHLLRQGTSAFRDDDYRSAAVLFRRALAYYRSIDDAHGQSLALINLAETALAVNDLRAAAGHVESLGRLTPRLPQNLQRRHRLLRARIAAQQGRRDEARRLLETLFPNPDLAADRTPTLDDIARDALLRRVALADRSDDDPALWLALAERWLGPEKRLAPASRARLLRLRAHVADQRDRHDEAAGLLEQALQAAHAAHDRRTIAATLEALAEERLHQDRPREAAALLERALPVRLHILDRPGSRNLIRRLARLYEDLGRADEAARVRRLLAESPASP